jgi:hypothetical protein
MHDIIYIFPGAGTAEQCDREWQRAQRDRDVQGFPLRTDLNPWEKACVKERDTREICVKERAA